MDESHIGRSYEAQGPVYIFSQLAVNIMRFIIAVSKSQLVYNNNTVSTVPVEAGLFKVPCCVHNVLESTWIWLSRR